MINTIIVLLGFLELVSGQSNVSNCVNSTTTVYLYNCSNASTSTPSVISLFTCEKATGCYPYKSFLTFYEDNLYSQYKVAGDATYALIVIHICLAPILLAALIVHRSPAGGYEAVARRISSTRKMLIWFSGIPFCLVDVVLFLWAPLTTMVFFVMFLHVVGTLLGLLVLFQTASMRASEILAKASDTLTSVQAHVVVDAYCLKHKIILEKAVTDDTGKNHDKFAAHICVPNVTDHGVSLPKFRFLGHGMTRTEAINSCYPAIDQYWSGLAGYAAVKLSLGTSSYDQVHVGEAYSEGLEMASVQITSESRAPTYPEHSLSKQAWDT